LRELSELMNVLAEWAANAPVTVYVYGSRVRGDHRTDSDVDLYVQHLNGQEAAGDEWYDAQKAENYSNLRGKLPGPIENVMPPYGAPHPLLFPHHEVARKGNVIALHTPPKAKPKGLPN
jgi:hypothetical protein